MGSESIIKYTKAKRNQRLMLLAATFAFVALFLHLIKNSSSPRLLDDPVIVETLRKQAPKVQSQASLIEQCTPNELEIVQKQLPPDDCIKNKGQPWLQTCSFTYATRCPEATWLDRYYTKLHEEGDKQSFVGIFIGCNKGMDAVNAMRMGSGDSTFDKSSWRNAMTKDGKIQLSNAVCAQDKTEQFNTEHFNTNVDGRVKFSQLHCIEAMPGTANALKESAHQLAWDERGFIVTHAAMSQRDGVVPFPKAAGVGVENQGMGNCLTNPGGCEDVTTYSLDSFASENVPKDVPINYLSVDVEGYDMDVLLGGMNHTISRVHYLEFEYNWMGAWKKQHLRDLIELLDERGFTCYWPGFDSNIWRITGCWLEHYDIHFWSNVACVNRHVDEVQSLAVDMERMFQDTISKGENLVMNRKKDPSVE